MSKYIIETILYKKHTIEILPDDDPMSPREGDNVGKMICFHSRYTLGDKHDYSSPDDFLTSLTTDFGKNPVLLSLYLYDHSGITMSSSPFSCPWDSGQVGWIVCSRENAVKNFGKKLFSKKVKEKALAYLESEVKSYDTFITGGYVGFRIKDKPGEETDSCWGFDDQSYAISEAKSVIDYTIKSALKKKVERLKVLIRRHVPLDARQAIVAL